MNRIEEKEETQAINKMAGTRLTGFQNRVNPVILSKM